MKDDTSMAVKKNTALALLRSGRSFAEAAESSGLPSEEVMRLWEAEMDAESAKTKLRRASRHA